jgi:hypothetical protein
MSDLTRILTSLRQACLLLTERGWCQGDYRDEHGALCAIGAEAKEQSLEKELTLAKELLHRAKNEIPCVCRWFDDCPRCDIDVFLHTEDMNLPEVPKSKPSTTYAPGPTTQGTRTLLPFLGPRTPAATTNTSVS